METFRSLFDLFLHLDEHLLVIIGDYGPWTYLVLFAVIFCETGLVITPFLPGDSLLFAAGALAGLGLLELPWLLVGLSVAAIVGDSVNYALGKRIGDRIFDDNTRILKREYLDRAHVFYERYGASAIILARFMPIVRTFAPFVAGMASMRYGRFLLYNVTGGLIWITLFSVAGYLFGNLPLVRDNFSLVIMAIIAVSLLPALLEALSERRRRRTMIPPAA